LIYDSSSCTHCQLATISSLEDTRWVQFIYTSLHLITYHSCQFVSKCMYLTTCDNSLHNEHNSLRNIFCYFTLLHKACEEALRYISKHEVECGYTGEYVNTSKHSKHCDIETLTIGRGSILCIESKKGLEDRGVGVRIPVGTRTVTSPYRPERFWGPPSLISIGYRGL
jgi:hypothetical protein